MYQTNKRYQYGMFFVTGFALLSACGSNQHSNPSNTKVTNGINIAESQFQSVVLLVMQHGSDQSICTGTFVNESQVVTAGHCVEGLDASSPSLAYVKITTNDQGESEYHLAARATSLTQHPDYDITYRNGVNGYDLAVVNFSDQSAPATSQLAKSSPAINSDLTIVGYGNNRTFLKDGQLSGDGAGDKRYGTNKIRAKDRGFLTFYGVAEAEEGLEPGQWVASGSGDSGGPMFVNGNLVGVTSGGGLATTKSGDTVDVSHYVDLNGFSLNIV